MRVAVKGLANIKGEFLSLLEVGEVLGLNRKTVYKAFDTNPPLMPCTYIAGMKKVHRSIVVDYLNRNSEGDIEYYDPGYQES